MKRKILRLANHTISPFGFRLQRIERNARMQMEDGLKHLVKKGCRPSTCIDVGVAHGTPALYETFPHAKHLLIEPLAEYEQDIIQIMKNYDCHYEQAAAGVEQGTLDIYVKEQITGSSIFVEQLGEPQGIKRSVRVVTLDQICKDQRLSGPYIVKIDVEGAEMDVIRGNESIMSDVLAFVLELTFVARLVDAPEAYEIISFMAGYDFVLYDFFDMRVRNDKTLFQADAVFVPLDSPYRSR